MYKWDEVKDPKKATFKNIFGLKGGELDLKSNKFVALLFKVKWYKVGSSLKPRKPYVITKASLTIPPGHVLVLNPPSS